MSNPSRCERGFSLIELLVVVSFIAILASIAIPRFTGMRSVAHDASIKTDLQNAMKAEEAWYVDNDAYVAFDVSDGGSTTTPPFTASPGVSVTAELVGDGVRIVGTHPGTNRTWCVSHESLKIVEADDC